MSGDQKFPSPCCPDEDGVKELMDLTEFWVDPDASDGDPSSPPVFVNLDGKTDQSDHNSYECRGCGNNLLWDRQDRKFVVDEGQLEPDGVRSTTDLMAAERRYER